MDILATQVYEDDSFMPTQQLCSLPHGIKQEELKIGTLKIGSDTYPIKQGITKIGRHPECNIILYDQTVSKHHAEIEVNSNETWICDLKSSNKTKLNSSVLRPGRYYELKGGSVIEFGMVRAVYSVLGAMDDSSIPETPAPSRARNQKIIIPGTPDTSMNYSSTSEGNVSTIPGTQAENGDSVFRRPSVPPRSSASIRKSYLPDSSMEDSMNDSRCSSASGKENSHDKRVSIHDIETQKSFDSQNELCKDIHDIETQKIWLCNNLPAAKQSYKRTNIHDMETQNVDMETERIVTDIHDVETQHDIDIHDLSTPVKTEVQNASVEGDEELSTVEKGQTEEAELKSDVSIAAEKNEIKQEKPYTNANYFTNSEQLETDQKRSQDCLELSIATNFDDEYSELDRSNNLLGSQNLLGDLISSDDPANESGSISVSPAKSFANNNETTEKSSDEENIFDVATQANTDNQNVLEGVTERVDYPFKASLVEDDSDDDTDQEGVFQRYSRIASQDSSQGTCLSKSQPDSDDSDTDEEGHFAAMGAKEKRAASSSFEVQHNRSKEAKNDVESSRDSDDLFDVATQQINLKDSPKGDVSKNSVDFDAPTQVVEVKKPGDMAEKGSVVFDTPTQVIDRNQPGDIIDKGNVNSDAPTQMIKVNKPGDIAEKDDVDFDTPTQVMDINQPVNVRRESNVNFDAATQLIEMNEYKSNVLEGDAKEGEDDMTPTQILPTSEVPRNVRSEDKDETDYDMPTQIIAKSVPIYDEPSSNDSERLNPHLIDEFSSEDIDYEMAPTQLLRDIEEQKKGASADDKRQSKKLNLDDTLERNLNEMFDDVNENIENDLPQMSTQVLTNMLESPQGKDEFADVIVDEELPERSKPKKSPRRTRLSRSIKAEELKAPEPVVEIEELPKGNKNVAKELGRGGEVSITSVDKGQSERTAVLDSDEDIMAGLPEVRISGTLSNPASPTSSTEFRLTTRNMKSKSGGKKSESKKKGTSKKTTRKSVASTSAENNEPPKIGRLRSAVLSSTFDNFDASRVPVTIYENDEDTADEIKPANRTSSRKSKGTLRTKTNPLHEEVRRSPSIQGSGRTGGSGNENLDSSSVFQVIKEALIATKAEPARQTAVKPSRAVKRSLSSTDVWETAIAKKRKEDVTGNTSVATKGRKSTRDVASPRSSSANILDYVMRTRSPVLDLGGSQQSITNSQGSVTTKELRIKITRLSSDTPTQSLSPLTPTRLAKEDDRNSVKSATSNSSKAENDKTTTVETRRGRSTRATSKRRVEDVSLQIGEESQEVEMILNSWVTEQNVNAKKQGDTNESTKDVRRKGARNRGYRNASNSEEMIENTSSEASESDNINFETSMSKSKRTTVSKNTTAIDNTATNESTKTVGRRDTRKRGQTNASTREEIVENISKEVSESDNISFETSTSKSKRTTVSKNTTALDNTATNESMRAVGRRDTRKRGQTNASTREEMIENTSSEASESDNVYFETSTSKSKRAKVSKNTTAIDNTATNESTKTVGRRDTRKRGQTNTSTSKEIVENISVDVSESDNARFETFTSKVKRTTVSKNTTALDNAATNESTRAVGRRDTRQRGQTNTSTREEIVENISMEVSESDDARFETSTSKAKRAKVSKNTTAIDNTATNESTKTIGRRGTRKRGQTNASTREEIVENISMEVSESDDARFETSMSKAKRAKVSKNTTAIDNTATNESTKTIGRRGTRKRGHANASSSEEIVENSSSEVYESDNTCFETSTLKAKRTAISKKSTDVDNTATNESTTRGRGKARQASRSTHSVTDSSSELLGTPINKTANRTGVTIEETTSLPTLAMSTPTRSRSLNASFVSSSPYKTKHRILFTGITNNYGKLLAKLGSSQVEDPTTCTVLVTDKVRRTFKFLCALAQAVPIVSVNWLIESEEAGHFTELDNYMLKDPAAEAKFGFRLRGSLEKAKKHKLLAGYTIVLTPNVAPPPLPELKSIISSCGGKPLVRPPSKWPQNSIIISREEDIANAKKFLAKGPKTVSIQSTEFILTGILRQELDFIKYKLT